MNAGSMYEIRRQRGSLRTSWLDARFSFSFGPYDDPDWRDFGPLAALNEDVVQPGTGFAMHPHRDLDIFMIPRHGAIAHEDSLGNRLQLAPGEVLMMRSGSGIRHSQMNPSATQLDHHFQLWLEPPAAGLAPAIELRRFDDARPGQWVPLASEHGSAGAFRLAQPARICIGAASAGEALALHLAPGTSAYLHVMEGRCTADIDGRREHLAGGEALVAYELREAATLRGAGADARFLLVLVPSSRVLRNRTRAETRAGK